jgi:hypothetical protein
VPLGQARAAAARLLGRLERSDQALRLAVTGAVRRMEPWVARVDLLATAHAAEPLLAEAAAAPAVAETLARTQATLEVRLKDGVHVRFEVLEDEARFGAALARSTGPERHVADLVSRARTRGLSWEGDRLLRGGVPQDCPEEADVYALLGLPWCPPERRGRADVTTPPPADLVTMADLVGVAGLHTNAGAGRYSLSEMAARAAREGYAWALAFATPDACAAWTPEPEAPLALIPASESWSAEDEEAWVVAVPATGLAGDPRADVVLLRSPPEGTPEFDVARLLDGLVASGAALGIAPPPRHPLPEPALLEAAAARGVPVMLFADAHDLVSLDDAVLVTGLARRGGLPRGLVLNALSSADLRAWRAKRRARHGLPA